MSAGVPSHVRFNAIFASINSREFETCLLSWITALHEITSGQVIAIDGKTLRRSFDAASSKSAIHMVSAWATANQISLRQVIVDEKSNEIAAIPKLLDLLDISGAIVTIDAMGCQTEIVEKIVSKQADCCIAVKKNQPQLQAAIEQHFNELVETDFADAKVRQRTTAEKGHGREEQRYYAICPVPASVKKLSRWSKVRAIGMAINVTMRGGNEHTAIRYYILTRYVSGKRFADAVRSHWGIENSLHWQLDATFREDDCRVRKGNSDANLSVIRRFALSMLKNEKSEKLGVKNKRLVAAWDNEYLAKVLLG
jgi:predicted transposase YbfD/YdcC